MFGQALLCPPCRFSLFGSFCLNRTLFVEQRKYCLFVLVWNTFFVGPPMRFAEFPDADGRQACIAVGNCKIAARDFIEKIQLTDVPWVTMKQEFAAMTGKLRVRSIDPRTQHIMIIMDVIDQDAVILYGTFDERHEIDTQLLFV